MFTFGKNAPVAARTCAPAVRRALIEFWPAGGLRRGSQLGQVLLAVGGRLTSGRGSSLGLWVGRRVWPVPGRVQLLISGAMVAVVVLLVLVLSGGRSC